MFQPLILLADSGWWGILAIPYVTVAAAIAIPITICGVANAWASTRRRESSMAAVRDMVAAGYTPEQVEGILKSAGDDIVTS